MLPRMHFSGDTALFALHSGKMSQRLPSGERV
jgi:hypothetical protein